MHYYKRLPLQGLSNARDLGGFPAHKAMTKYGVFVRSELPSRLTQRDIDFLRDYGITKVIDFRGDQEREFTADQLASEDFIDYVTIPMFDSTAALGAMRTHKKPITKEFTWGNQYVIMTEDYKHWVKKIFASLVEGQGGTLYHCTTGKDRAGIITALLLGACGVEEMDIIADYSVSQIYLQSMYKNMNHLLGRGRTSVDLSDPFFSTAPANMEMLLDHFNAEYGGIQGYLLSCDISQDLIDQLRHKLLEPA